MDNQARDYGQQNLTLPHDIVPLPSGGVFYRNKKKSVKVGYLTAMDENILMGGGDFTTSLLRNKIYEPDFKLEDMLEGDVEAILIFLRNTAFGPEINLNLIDPVTKKEFKATVMIDQLPIKQGSIPDENGTFTLFLPRTQATVKLKPMSYGEIKNMNDTLENYPQGRIPPKRTLRLQKEIVEVNGKTDLLSVSSFVESLPISDSKLIKTFMLENEPRLDMNKQITTPSGEKLTVNVGFGVDFFRPFF